MNNRFLLNSSVIVLGVVFLVSGIAKGMDIQGFGEILMGFGLDWLYFLAPIISASEIFLGFGLLFIISPRTLGKLSLIVTIVFTVILVLADVFLGITDCGCMGSMLQVPMYVSYIRNVILIVLSHYIYRNYPATDTTTWSRIRFVTACLFAFISASVSVFEIASAYSYTRAIQGMNIKSTFLPDVIELPSSDRYLIFAFQPTCSHCRHAVIKLKEIKAKGLIDDIVGIYPSSAGATDIAAFINDFQIDFTVRPLRYDSINAITHSKKYPAILYVKSDIVVSSFSHAPSFNELE